MQRWRLLHSSAIHRSEIQFLHNAPTEFPEPGVQEHWRLSWPYTTTLQTSPSSSYIEFTRSLGWEAERKEGKEGGGGKGKGAYARMQEEEDARIERDWSTSVRGNNARDWHESCNPSSQGNTPLLLLLLAIAPPCFTTKLSTVICCLGVVEKRMKKFKPNSFWRQIRSNKTLKCDTIEFFCKLSQLGCKN